MLRRQKISSKKGVRQAKKYVVEVIIENKAYINDPEGETIHRDLIVKGGYSDVNSVRSAKMLRMIVNSNSRRNAEEIITRMCEDLRIFNPVVSNCSVKAIGLLENSSGANSRN